MEKRIMLGTGEIVELGYEGLVSQFENMVSKIAIAQYNCYKNRPATAHMGLEDFEQEVMIVLWNAFEKYDIEMGNCFSTYFKVSADRHFSNFNRIATSKKVDGDYSLVSLQTESTNEGEKEVADLVGNEEVSYREIEEMDAIRTMIETMDEQEKTIFINELSQKRTYEQLSRELGMTRQNLNYLLRKKYKPNWEMLFKKYFKN